MPQTEIIDPFEMQTVRLEHKGDTTVFHYAQDISAIQNNNETERKDCIHDGRSEFRKVASIPDVKWNEWEKLGITQDQKALRKAIQLHKDELMTTNKRLI